MMAPAASTPMTSNPPAPLANAEDPADAAEISDRVLELRADVLSAGNTFRNVRQIHDDPQTRPGLRTILRPCRPPAPLRPRSFRTLILRDVSRRIFPPAEGSFNGLTAWLAWL